MSMRDREYSPRPDVDSGVPWVELVFLVAFVVECACVMISWWRDLH